MDKRIVKTDSIIYNALSELLNTKPFEKITVNDIIEKAQISRSTFYSHYKTKEDVLSSVCQHIFDHVFSHSLKEEKTHDFSKSNILDYLHLITHILYHLHDEKELVKAILNNSSRDLFYNNMREKFSPIAKIIVQNDPSLNDDDLPLEIQINKVVETFIIVIDYWFKNDCLDTPEKITNYFFKLN